MPKYTEDQNGYISFLDNPISKSGVFPYLGKSIDPDGSRGLNPEQVYNVYRPESELNNPDTINSFKLSPWIPGHTMLGTDFCPAEDVGVQGVTGENVYFKNGTLYSNLKVFGESLKNAIRAGLKELSCGFRCAWDIVSGITPDGVAYDVIQREIRGNHLASVPEGRMGSDVSVAMDRAVFALDNLDIEPRPDGEQMTATIEEMMAKVKEAQPAKEELKKLAAEINAMIDEEGGELTDPKMDKDTVMDEDPEADPKDKEEKPTAMDEKEIAKIVGAAVDSAIKPLTERMTKIEGAAMDAKDFEKKIAAKQSLTEKVFPLVGRFDTVGMNAQDVAAKVVKDYGEKLGIACDSGQELATLNGYLAARSKPQTTVDSGTAFDAADDEIPESLKGVL